MIVSGKPLAEKILDQIRTDIAATKIQPTLSIILAGNNPASRMYIKHKTIIGDEIGIHVTTYEFTPDKMNDCTQTIINLNKDPLVHGVIVQLPMYPGWDADNFVTSVAPEKDVDGFVEGSPYLPATAEGTWEMLNEFARLENLSINEFLNNKKIVVLGKGKTAGKPVRDLLAKNGYESTLIDSKTPNPNEIIKEGDLIISATGKKNIINDTNVKDGVYIIGIGVGKEEINGKNMTFGDLDEKALLHKAKFICPTLGGIGPLTIACLLRNVYRSASHATS